MHTFSRPVYFAPDEPTGGGEPASVADAIAAAHATPPAPPAAPVVETTPPVPPVPPAPPVPVAVPDPAAPPVPPAGEPVDWDARVTEWGGADEVASAVATWQALGTREGLADYMRQASVALGIPVEEVEKLLTPPAPPAPPATAVDLDKLLADDPDRPLTAREIAAILSQRDAAADTGRAVEQGMAAISTAVDDALTAAKVAADSPERVAIIAMAEAALGDIDHTTPPATIAAAVTAAATSYEAAIEARAQAILKEKGLIAAGLPSPLPVGGGAPAGVTPTEPRNIKEASAIARASLLPPRS